MNAVLLDTDTLSEIMKGRDPGLRNKAGQFKRIPDLLVENWRTLISPKSTP